MPSRRDHPEHRPDLYQFMGNMLWKSKETGEFVTLRRGKVVYAGPPDLVIDGLPTPSPTPSPQYWQQAPGHQSHQQFAAPYGAQMAAPMWVPAQQQVAANWLQGPDPMAMAMPMEEQPPLLSDEELQAGAYAQAMLAQQTWQNMQVYPTGMMLQAQPLVGQAAQPWTAPMGGAKPETLWEGACQKGVALSDLTLPATEALEDWEKEALDLVAADALREMLEGHVPAPVVKAN